MDNNITEFLRGEPLGGWLWDWFHEWREPFSAPTVFNKLSADLAKKFVEALERLIGKKLYVKKNLNDPDHIPRRFYPILQKCADKGIAVKISYSKPIAGWPRIPGVTLGVLGMNASGFGLDYQTASVKAVAEMLERFSLARPSHAGFVHGSYDGLKNKGALDPAKFALFSERQLASAEYAEHRVDGKSIFHWLACSSFFDSGRHLIPAQLVYLGNAKMKNEPLIQRVTSNGAAAGASYDMALHNALCEAVERDALVIYWLNSLSPAKIDLRTLSKFKNKTMDAILTEYKKFGISVSLLDITTDIGVPVFMAVISGMPDGWPPVFISPHADLDIESAIVACLLDGLRAGHWPKVNEDLIREAEGRGAFIDSFEKRRAQWCLPGASAQAEFLFAGETKDAGENKYRKSDFSDKLKKIKELFRAQKFETYIVDITQRVAKEAGLTILKTITPELCPLYLVEHFKYLGVKRLYEAPVNMGRLAAPKKETELNAFPHPML